MLVTMPKENEIRADFRIQIDFDKKSPQPSRVFRSMSELIETFEAFDRDLARSVDSRIETVLLLEDIESGSIVAWFISKIEAIDDEVLKSGDWKKAMGAYLVKAKYITLDFLQKITKITNREEIEELQRSLLKAAEATDVHILPAYASIPREKLLGNIERIASSLTHLSPKDKATYITDEYEIPFNREFDFIPEEIEDLITKQTLTGTHEMILKVKKPDYLGESMWEVKHGKGTISAKIKDEGWLQKFQKRDVDIRPGDSIRAKVEIAQKYDYDNNLVATHYTILEVLEILAALNVDQLRLGIDSGESEQD
jgi:hypothetical protein